MHGQICLQNVRRSLWILRMPTGITMTRISFRWRKTGENLEDGCRFYVLTNNMDHGAVYMMDEATLQKSAEKLDANLIVLPASIHEVYLMVEREGLDMERLRDGVYGANRAFPEADYLSDEIYRYDRDTHRLSVILGSVQEEQAGMVLYQ